MTNKCKIYKLLILTLFVYYLSFGSVHADDNELNDSEYTDEEVSNPHQLPPDYGPFRDDVIEGVKKSPFFIATRGSLPNITSDDEKVEWGNSVFKCSQSLSNPYSTNTGISPYFAEFGGPVVLFGYSGEGYIEVGLESDSPEKVNESIIDEIYQVIDVHCEKEGISNVPVVFVWTHIVETVDKDEAYADKDGNLSIINDETTKKNNESTQMPNHTSNKTPGFTSFIATLGLLSLFIVKRL
jgi:hypothetical protein